MFYLIMFFYHLTWLKPFAPPGTTGHWQLSSTSLGCCWFFWDRSARTARLRLVPGRPLFLVLWGGFHFRACQVMFVAGFMRVCPVQLHLLLQICKSAGSWLVPFHRSTLLTLSLHQMFSILQRQLLMNVCSPFVVCFVVLHAYFILLSLLFTYYYNTLSLLTCIRGLLFLTLNISIKIQQESSSSVSPITAALTGQPRFNLLKCPWAMIPGSSGDLWPLTVEVRSKENQ